jgi:hypothetical protein
LIRLLRIDWSASAVTIPTAWWPDAIAETSRVERHHSPAVGRLWFFPAQPVAGLR